MNVGGVQTFVLTLSRYFRQLGDDVTVIVTENKGKWWPRLDEENINGICLPRREYLCPVSHSLALARMIKDNRYNAVFLNHTREGQIGIPLYNEGAVVVPIVHNDTAGITQLAIRNWRYWNLLIAVSPRLMATVQRSVPHKAVAQLNYPVDMPTETTFNKRYPWQRRLRLLYVGRLHEQQKGVMLLSALLENCHANNVKARLSIVGAGDDRSALQGAFEQRQLSDYVVFHGICTPHQIRTHMLHSHALLMPSHYEGLGIVAVEAQACGCVPLATRLPGVTDHSILNGETGFLIDDRDPSAYAIRIRELSTNRTQWEAMSHAGRAHVLDRFGVETMGAAFRQSVLNANQYQEDRKRIPRALAFIAGTNLRDWYPTILRTSAVESLCAAT